MIDWLKSNKVGITIIIIAIGLIGVIAGMQGCALDDMVRMNNPRDVQQATSTPAQITLSAAPDIRADYVAKVERSLKQFDASYESAGLWRDLVASGINLGVVTGNGALAGLPGGAILTTLFAGFGGLMLRKPGDAQTIQGLRDTLLVQNADYLKRLRQEKEDSYNAGIKVGSSMTTNDG